MLSERFLFLNFLDAFMDEFVKKILEILESKQRDCMTFAKKHKTRGNDELHQYYEGAEWALKYSITTIKEEIEGN